MNILAAYEEQSPIIKQAILGMAKPMTPQEITEELKNPNSFIARCVAAFVTAKLIEELMLQLQQNQLKESLLKKLAAYMALAHVVKKGSEADINTTVEMIKTHKQPEPSVFERIAQLQLNIQHLMQRKIVLEQTYQADIKKIVQVREAAVAKTLDEIVAPPANAAAQAARNELDEVVALLAARLKNQQGQITSDDQLQVLAAGAKIYEENYGKLMPPSLLKKLPNQLAQHLKIESKNHIERTHAYINDNKQLAKELDSEVNKINNLVATRKAAANKIPSPNFGRNSQLKKEEEEQARASNWPPKPDPFKTQR